MTALNSQREQQKIIKYFSSKVSVDFSIHQSYFIVHIVTLRTMPYPMLLYFSFNRQLPCDCGSGGGAERRERSHICEIMTLWAKQWFATYSLSHTIYYCINLQHRLMTMSQGKVGIWKLESHVKYCLFPPFQWHIVLTSNYLYKARDFNYRVSHRMFVPH